MHRPSPEEQEAIMRRMEEICSEVLALRDQKEEIPLSERARIVSRLTKEWIAQYRKLRGEDHH